MVRYWWARFWSDILGPDPWQVNESILWEVPTNPVAKHRHFTKIPLANQTGDIGVIVNVTDPRDGGMA